MKTALPTGNIAFLFTDIEDSTLLLERMGDVAFASVLEIHNRILADAIGREGLIVRIVGDSYFAVFAEPFAAVEAAVQAQMALHLTEWPDSVEVRVRMGIHLGEAVLGGDDYVGIDVHRASRVSDAANGGQVLLTSTVVQAIDEALPPGAVARPLGAHVLKGLSRPEQLYQLDIEGLESDFPPLRVKGASANRLPPQLTSFVGRAEELEVARDVLQATRLLTLTGPGGTGKTRLAIELARSVAGDYLDGAHFVPLESVVDPSLVATAILDGLGLHGSRSGGDPVDRLHDHLVDKNMLLILDNFEQILAASSVVAGLLSKAPELELVITSRAPLRIPGEREIPVPPLSLGTDAGHEALDLFLQRATEVRPDFEITDGDRSAVIEIVRRLDGLPLAIELAASRMRAMTPKSMLDRLDIGLLSSPAVGMPQRQQTIINTIGWSYDLLDEASKRLFEKCSVFMGGATLEHIEQISGDESGSILDSLGTLVDHSLLRFHPRNGEPRYQMLVVVREFAYGALVARSEDGEVREVHSRMFATLASAAEPWLLTSSQRTWLDRLGDDHENLRSALDWAIENESVDRALGMVSDLWRFWQIRGYLDEAAERIDAALALDGGSPRRRAKALEAKGGVTYWRGGWVEAREPYQKSLDLMRDHGDAVDIANALYNLSFPVGYAGDYHKARELLEQARVVAEGENATQVAGRAIWALADIDVYEGDFPSVIERLAESERIFEQIDAPFDLAWARFLTAHAHVRQGQFTEARSAVDRAIPHFAAATDLTGVDLILRLKAMLSLQSGDGVLAARLEGAGRRVAGQSGARMNEMEVNTYAEISQLLADPSPEVAAALEEGKQMSIEEAVALAVSA